MTCRNILFSDKGTKIMNRRIFTKAGIAGLAAGFAGCGESTEKVVKIHSLKKVKSKPYGIQYYEKACEIWKRISTIELPLIAQAADRATSSLKNGNSLYCQIVGGHMHLAEFRAKRPGNPNYLPNMSRSIKDEEFEAIGKGDFLFFDYPKTRVKKIRDRGAFTLGIRTPYFPNKTTPKGVLAMEEWAVNPLFTDIMLPEDCSDIVLTSGVPFTDGVLYIPEISAVRPCPISPQGTFNFYWILTAEIVMRDKGGGAVGTSSKALEYIELIKQRGTKIKDNFDRIDAIARAMVEYVSRGGRYWNYTFSDGPRIMATENTNRASGLFMSRLIDLKDINEKGKAGDFVIMAGEASDVKENFEAAEAFKSAGIKVIYIGPAKTEGSQGNDITKVADWHIDTFSPEREGSLTVHGYDRKICPTTGILYALSVFMLNSQFIGHMIETDMTPLVYMGVHLIGGRVYNNLIREIWATRGY